MNYIKQLEHEKLEMAQKLTNANNCFNQFIKFLYSSKFVGLENGERKDWISTSDVIDWIVETRKEIL